MNTGRLQAYRCDSKQGTYQDNDLQCWSTFSCGCFDSVHCCRVQTVYNLFRKWPAWRTGLGLRRPSQVLCRLFANIVSIVKITGLKARGCRAGDANQTRRAAGSACRRCFLLAVPWRQQYKPAARSLRCKCSTLVLSDWVWRRD